MKMTPTPLPVFVTSKFPAFPPVKYKANCDLMREIKRNTQKEIIRIKNKKTLLRILQKCTSKLSLHSKLRVTADISIGKRLNFPVLF
jgi:hypothetical protein